MRILLLGAYGFIGSEIGRRLLESGQAVTAVGRDVEYGRRVLPDADWIKADLKHMQAPADWAPYLADVDGVVNASGLLQSGAGESVGAVQRQAVTALVEAATKAGLKSFVQISATGAQLDASTDFMRTKAAADQAVLSAPLNSAVLRPGLVIGRNSYGGTELIRAAAALPMGIRLTFAGPIQCVALADVVDAVEAALRSERSFDGPVDLVEDRRRSIDEVITMHREWLAVGPPRISLSVPPWMISIAAAVSDGLGKLGWRSPLRSNAVEALRAGATGNSRTTADLLGREPKSLEEMLGSMASGKQDRLAARLYLLTPLIVAALFLMWFLSGAATLLDPSEAEALLTGGTGGTEAARAAVLAGAIVDAALALALLWRPAARAAAIGMVLLTIVYLAAASILAPSLWFDPLAPLAKAVPAALLATTAAWLLEKR